MTFPYDYELRLVEKVLSWYDAFEYTGDDKLKAYTERHLRWDIYMSMCEIAHEDEEELYNKEQEAVDV